MLKRTFAASAEANFNAVSNQFTAASGNGTMKYRNATGKAMAIIHFPPRVSSAPAISRQTYENAQNDRKSP